MSWSHIKLGQKYRLVSGGIIIYGEVVDPIRLGFPNGRPTDEQDGEDYDEEVQYHHEQLETGIAFVKAYSEACPHGEMGSCDMTTVEYIPDDKFEVQMARMEWGKDL
jgi:hypothetical protein